MLPPLRTRGCTRPPFPPHVSLLSMLFQGSSSLSPGGLSLLWDLSLFILFPSFQVPNRFSFGFYVYFRRRSRNTTPFHSFTRVGALKAAARTFLCTGRSRPPTGYSTLPACIASSPGPRRGRSNELRIVFSLFRAVAIRSL